MTGNAPPWKRPDVLGFSAKPPTNSPEGLFFSTSATWAHDIEKQTRGPNPKEDVSEFTCGTLGKECPMQDGGYKATVAVYYNGPLLVVLKTHGRKDSLVEKQRFSLSPAGDSLVLEIMHTEPESKAERLVFTKAQ